MIHVDRKVIRAILSLTNNYHDEMTLDSTSSAILLIRNNLNIINSVPVHTAAEDVSESIERLIDLGYLRVSRRWLGGYSFCMTSLLKHRKAFWWDSFSKKFWGGFISGLVSGIIVTVLGGLLLSFLRAKMGI